MQRQFIHPSIEDITLAGILYALADPTRLTIALALKRANNAINCQEASPSDLPRSTLSHHYKILRESGLVRSHKKGKEVFNTLRYDELNEKFPGVLDAILTSASTDA